MTAITVDQPTPDSMTSIELLALINQYRAEFGETEVRRNDFHARVRDELDGEHYEIFVVPNSNGTESGAFRLSLRQCMYVAMRESKGVRRRVQDKLEAANQPIYHVPQSLSAALRLAADQQEEIERQQQALALAAPKVEFVDRYVQAETGSMGFRQVCKLLKANEAEFRCFLTDKGFMYRLGGKLTPTAAQISAGRFETITGVTSADEARSFVQSKFTAKGVQWIAGEWGKHCAAKSLAA